MFDTELQLKNSPIIEAVLDIDCDLQPALDHAQVDLAAKSRLASSFPKASRRYATELRTRVEDEPELEVAEDISALQYRSNDDREIVQFRPNGFSFNRLAPYDSFDDYISTIEWTWGVYLELATPIEVTKVSLRTINKLPIPLKDGRLEFKEFFRVPPTLPDTGLPLAFHGFFEQHMAIDQATGNQVRIVKHAQEPEGDTLPVVLDIDAFYVKRLEPHHWSDLLDHIQLLRDLKNRVFEHTLTEGCMSLFSPGA